MWKKMARGKTNLDGAFRQIEKHVRHHVLPYKPINVPGLYGEVVRPAITVAVDHPPGNLQCICQMDRLHGLMIA